MKVSSSLIALSPRFEGLKVAAVPRGKRDLTVFDFRMYLNPDRTETADFVGPLSEVVFGSTRPFHRSLAPIKRFKKRPSALQRLVRFNIAHNSLKIHNDVLEIKALKQRLVWKFHLLQMTVW